MAAKTPDSLLVTSFGSLTLYIATFSTNDMDDNDTWATGLNGIVGYWCNPTDDPTQEKEHIDLSLSSGTITFHCGEANREGMVYVLQKP